MDIEDHIPQEHESTLQEQVQTAVADGDFNYAGYLLTTELGSFLADYLDDESINGLLKIASYVEVLPVEGITCIFNTKRCKVSIPQDVAVQIRNGHDLAFLLIAERNRLIVGRSAHVYIPDDMDLSQNTHKAVYDMALTCWSIALARCFCASILPERLYGPYPDLPHNLMHGIAPDQFSQFLHKQKYKLVADRYLSLYNMGGQEQYHAVMDRIASDNTSTIPFQTVLEDFWEDFKKDTPTDEELEQMIKSKLMENPDDGEDDIVKDLIESIRQASKQGHMHAVPTADLDVETELDRHLAQFMRYSCLDRHSYYNDALHGLGSRVPSLDKMRGKFQGLNHTITIEADDPEEEILFGSLTPPMHPSTHDLVLLQQGINPGVWETRMQECTPKAPDIQYTIYFDVSGSMFRWMPVVRALLRQLGVFANTDCYYGFSTEVVEIEMDAAYVMTTGGTDIECSIKHAQDNGVKHILLVTDLQDSGTIDTKGIEHIVIVATDCNKDIDIQHTVFSDHDPNTKIDVYPVNYDEIVSSSAKMSSLCDKIKGGASKKP